MEAAVKAVETVDECVGKVVDKLISKVVAAIITADHGNAEYMIDSETRESYNSTFNKSSSIYSNRRRI